MKIKINNGLKVTESLVRLHLGDVDAVLVSVRSRFVLVQVFYAVVVPFDLFLQYLMFDLKRISKKFGRLKINAFR